jgi:uncharacterized protein (TIGR00299 family) protein
MTLAAFIDLGVPLKWLQEQLKQLPVRGFDISTEHVYRNGIRAHLVHVIADDDKTHRNYADIKGLIEASTLSDDVKATSLEVFRRIAEAEAGIHGCTVEEIHFHEVGGIDAIVDIVGAALCIDYMGIETVVASKIPLGSGFVECRHGKIPIPAPATAAILKDVPVYGSGIAAELVTPTGAGIITTLADSFGSMPSMLIEKTGYGAGQRDLEEIPNLLRVFIGTPDQAKAPVAGKLSSDRITIVESCIDDMNPEVFGFLMEQLFDLGALDVYWVPVYMKKNRPGTMIQILCASDHRDAVINCVLTETTSLGVRYYQADRCMLKRDVLKVQTSFGEIDVKRIINVDGSARFTPEFEECRRIARDREMPLRSVYDAVNREIAALKK